MKALVAVLFVAGCSLGSDGAGTFDGGGGMSDAGGGDCVTLTFAPSMPVTGDHVKVTATVFASGTFHYRWKVDGVDNANYEAADDSAIGFDVPDPVSHTVEVALDPAGTCSGASAFINVSNAGGVQLPYRLRVTPADSIAPPQEQTILVTGGTQQVTRPIHLDAGIALAATVQSAAGMIAAYVKLTPQVGPSFDLVTIGPIVPRVLPLDHTVLVVPMDTTLAPRAFTWSPGVGPNVFLVDAGTAVTGTVVDRGGAPLSGAQIQLVQAGVPSTIATTAANGTFTARASFGAAATTTITVTPPATSGLAKLAATAAFDLAQPINVSFAASPATCDLAGTRVLRGGVNQNGAIVSVVGAVGAAGTIAGVSATGMFHASATATAGTLPSLLVPRAALGAVAQIAANDYAVVALDTSACVAQTIDAPARIAKAGTIDSPGGLPVGGVRIEAVPTGTLALANLIPVEAVTASDGTWAMQVASGATYDVKVIDPAGRGTKQLAPSAFPPATMRLDKAQVLNGTITLVDGGNVVEGAAVQLLCASCSGLAAQTPIAATATDITGFYQLAIPDPGSL